MKLEDLLVFLIPLAVLEIALLAYTLRHIFTHDHYKRGSRLMWCLIVIAGMEFIGPLLYFVIGKENDR